MQRRPRATEKKNSSYFVVGDHSDTPEGLSKTLASRQQFQNFLSGSQLSVVQHGVDATHFRESYTKGTKLNVLKRRPHWLRQVVQHAP